MKTYQLTNANLIVHHDYLELQLLHECHFDDELLQQSFQIKKNHFNNNKIGILIIRQNLGHAYSFDPSILINEKEKLENHAKWVTVISEKENDFQNLEFVKMLTTIPCYSFESYQDFESSLVGEELQLKNGN